MPLTSSKIQFKVEDNKKSSYRSIFKATSLFGGVQIFHILIQIIRSKFIAVLLGPTGVGIIGLYQAAYGVIAQITSCGLSQSAVRDVSEANGTGDIIRISRTITILKRIIWITGLTGTIVFALLSPLLSKWSFGNYDYTIPFIYYSITLLLDQICTSQRVILQSVRKLKHLAKSSLIGSTLGLIFTIPLYYWFGIDGIVPTLIIYSLLSVIITHYYARKIKIIPQKMSTKEIYEGGKNMLVMGISMSISGAFTALAAYLLRGYIRNHGGMEDVGLFQAGFALMTTYVGLVFNAMATDFYPRLSSVNQDNKKCKEVICQQGEISTLILAPILCAFIVFIPIVITLLYSDAFHGAKNYIIWACLGMMFKLASWLVAMQLIAKADSKLFIINELIGNVSYLVCSIVGYSLDGLTGLGIAFLTNYIIYFLQVYVICRIRYGFSFNQAFNKIFVVQLLFVISVMISSFIIDGGILNYVVGSVLTLMSILFTFFGLKQRMDLSFAKIIK